eukprot:sb/3469859/
MRPASSGTGLFFFSDSQAVLKKLMSPFLSTKQERNTAQTLDRLVGVVGPVELHWIRGHMGCAGNELADEAAKKAAESSGPSHQLPLPVAYLKSRNKAREREELIRSFETLPSSENKLRYMAATWRPLPSDYSNTDLYRLSNILNNRFPLRVRLADSICRRCKLEVEDNYHFICVCPRLFLLRNKTFGRFTVTKEQLNNFGPSDILRFITDSEIFTPPHY